MTYATKDEDCPKNDLGTALNFRRSKAVMLLCHICDNLHREECEDKMHLASAGGNSVMAGGKHKES